MKSEEIQNTVAEIVMNIIAFKQNNSNYDTSELENRIDKIVYQIYGLTEEEIKVVEGM